MDGKIIKKSAKTESKADAIKFAKEFYNSLLLKKQQNLPLTASPTFERVALELLRADEALALRGERKQRYLIDEKQVLNADILPFFRKYNVRDINYTIIQRYVDQLHEGRKKPLALSSVKTHLIYVRKILKHAWKLDMIDSLPIFPSIRVKDNPREWFSKDQYNLLKTTIKKAVNDKTVVRYHQITDEMYQLVLFMVGTFLRPSDLKNLQHQNIEIIKANNTSYLRIRPASSKTVNRPVVSMNSAVMPYTKLLAMHKADAVGEPSNYVMYPHLANRAYAFNVLRRQFNHVLAAAGLKHSPTGATRTLYSLRHTAIMFRLLNGENIDLLTLARNCRTSVEMISRFYASHLDAEMNVDKLHSMKKRKTPAKGKTTNASANNR